MKKFYLFLMFLICNLNAGGQITITQNDMPHDGDTARFTTAAINPLIDFSSTGANYTWDYSDLRSQSQGLQEFIDVSTTNIVYAIVFANIPFLPNRSNVASNTTEFPTNPLVSLTNPYNFYYRNSSEYRQTGFGAEIGGLPVPIPFNNHDVIYNLPLNFGDTTTSISDWNVNVPGVGDLGYWQTRTNQVDGWGTLITPFNTYNALRVITTRLQRDTVALDTLAGFAVDRPIVKEYKWLANGEVIPVMQITTMEIFGFEVVTDIYFRDEYIKIETNPISANIFCAGDSVLIPYTKYGTFNGPGLFTPGNVFTAQLSDSLGSFSNPVDIGTVTSTQSGIINGTIPLTIGTGTNYRIRVLSSDLPIEGSDNGSDITIFHSPPGIDSISISGSLVICSGDSVTLSIDSNSNYTYQWMNNGNTIPGETFSSYTATTPGNYSVEVTNVCGMVASNTVSVTVESIPLPAIITALSNSGCSGDSILLTSNASGPGLQWQLNGSDLSGAITSNLYALTDGDYTLISSNNCGSSVSNMLALTFNSLPPLPVINQSNDTLYSSPAPSYQWFLNGMMINGANTINFHPVQNGAYTVVITDTNGCSNISAVYNFTSVGLINTETVLLKIYPNPASSILNIRWEKEIIYRFTIQNLLGEIIMTVIPGHNDSEASIKIGYLSKGLYILQCQLQNGILNYKFVKQ